MMIDDNDNVSVSSLATPRPLEDGDISSVPQQKTFAKRFYVAENSSILSLGLLNNNGTLIFDKLVLSWSAAFWPMKSLLLRMFCMHPILLNGLKACLLNPAAIFVCSSNAEGYKISNCGQLSIALMIIHTFDRTSV
jgi:hypothetical protein